jgi:DNA-directed RNA polymerase specialized sigma24 family protein
MSPRAEPVSTSLEALLDTHGAAIGSFAYLTLQHQADAEHVVSATLATALRRRNPPDEAGQRNWLLGIAAREILRGSSQTGEVAPILPDGRSPADRMAVLEGLAELDPRSRMAVVLHHAMDLPTDAVAAILGDDSFALRSDMNDARNRILARVEEQEATEGLGATSPPRERFDDRLKRALAQESARFQPLLNVALLGPAESSFRATRPGGPRRRLLARGLPIALVTLLVAGVAAFFWLVPESRPAAGLGAASRPASPFALPAPGPITLADCKIAPADSPLAFAGWTTLAALDVHGGEAAPGQPIYAVVTRGLAEWIGWQDHYTGPMYPPPIGRMGCIFDPSTRKTSLVGVDQDWQPNVMADGCPPSPIDKFGGYRELGGPHAWLLLPNDASVWHVGKNTILFRLSPTAQPGQSISAWTQPLADSPRVAAEIDSASAQLGLADSSGSGSQYYVLSVRFTSSGCWVINVAIDGQVVGSAIAPIAASPLVPALPRRQGSR